MSFLQDRREQGFPFLSQNSGALLGAGMNLLNGGRDAWSNAFQGLSQGAQGDRQRAEQQRQEEERARLEEAVMGATGNAPPELQGLFAAVPELGAQFALDEYTRSITPTGGGMGGGYVDEVRNGILGYVDPDGRWQPYPEWTQPGGEDDLDYPATLNGIGPNGESIQLIRAPDNPNANEFGYVQMGGARPPDGMQITLPDGTQISQGGGGGDVTGAMRQAATFAQRMTDADAIINDPAIIAGGATLTAEVLNNLGTVGNAAMAPEARQFAQASRNFINAVLRRESGAAISEGEFADARRQYLPAPWDDPVTLAQKARNRQVILAGLIAEAGPQAVQQMEQALQGLMGPTATPDAGDGWTDMGDNIRIRPIP